MFMNRILLFVFGLFASMQASQAQRFMLFSQEVRDLSPSVVYDFLERYLFEVDSLQSRGENIDLRLHDDKVFFRVGSASTAKRLTPDMTFSVSKTDDKFYEVLWTDTLGNAVLDVAFPMQYELLLGKPKVAIEKEFKDELLAIKDSVIVRPFASNLVAAEDSCQMSEPQTHYYVESMNDATYYSSRTGTMLPVFSGSDKWHSAANLFQGVIEQIGARRLFVEQNLYGFQKTHYTISLAQWIRYCHQMQMTVYFAIEEEREDGLKCLLIAQNKDLGFNHMLSIIMPDDFVSNQNCTIKATLNAYIPTQNIKNLYQQYVDKPKKKI